MLFLCVCMIHLYVQGEYYHIFLDLASVSRIIDNSNKRGYTGSIIHLNGGISMKLLTVAQLQTRVYAQKETNPFSP